MFGMDAGAPVVWMVGNMVAVYLEMGCVEEPESLEC